MKGCFLIVIALGFLNCSTDAESTVAATPDLLQGQWVEAESRKDTLSFEAWDSMDVLILGREREVRGGMLLPKTGTGAYQYQLTAGKIALIYILSSSTDAQLFDFTLLNGKLRIGDFYGAGSGNILTFVRLE